MPIAQTGKRLLRTLISPDQFDFWAQELGSTAAWERCFARVLSVTAEARDTVNLSLKPNANFPGFRPGQHMNLTATIGGRRITRSYSFTGLPDGAGQVSLTVRRDADGLMSNWLCSEAAPGDVVEISAVFGELSLERMHVAPQDEMVLLAAGSGITPLLSLIRARTALGHPGKLTLLYWERGPDYFCFTQELDALRERHANIAIYRLSTRTDGAEGRISDQQVEKLLGTVSEPHNGAKPIAVICGGSGFVESAKAIMAARARQCHAEAFTPPRAALSADQAATVSVELLKSQRTLSVSNQQTLLEALEKQGVTVASGCRMGICNTCACPTARGDTRDITTGLINSGRSTKLCISQATGDLQLEL